MDFRYVVPGKEDEVRAVRVQADGDRFRVTIGERTYEVEAQHPEHGRLNLTIDGRRVRAYVAADGSQRYVAFNAACAYLLQVPDTQAAGRRRGLATPQGGLEAAMPGQVLDVLVKAGDVVARGQTLLLLEAMKMELRIAAPFAGTVRKVRCAAGEVVERGQLLVELEAQT